MVNSYVAVDLETTGLSPKENKIIEIGAIKVIDGEVAGSFETFVNPRVAISSRITELTGITDEMVQGAPYEKEAVESFIEFCGDNLLLGHNVRFDYSFLKVAATNSKIGFEHVCIDTLRIARVVLPELPSKSLDRLTTHFQLMHDNKHRALSDAQAASLLYQKLYQEYYQGNEKCFEPVKYDMKFKRESAITPKQIKYLSDLCKRYDLNLGVEIEGLTKNAASRMIDRIRSQYGYN